MLQRRKRLTRVPARLVVFGVIVLAGVLSMAYGYFFGKSVVLYAGLGVALFGSFNTVIHLIANPGSPRFMREWHNQSMS